MINCPNCNAQVPEGTKFCPNCGAQIPEMAQPVQHQGYVQGENPYQQQYNQPQGTVYGSQGGYNQPYTYQPEDKTNVGLCVLSVFIPLFGIIYYFCTRQKKPKEAKGCLKAGLISAGVSIVLSLIITFVAIGSVFRLADKAIDKAGDYTSYSEDIDFGFDEDFENNEDLENKEKLASSEAESAESKSSTTAISKNGSDWKNYTVNVNGTEISLPISYSEFSEKTGYTFKSDDDANSTLKGNYYNIVSLKKGDSKISVTLVNEGSEMKTNKECIIRGISAYQYQQAENVIFPGNLKVDMNYSKDDLISAFGTPDKEYDKDGYYDATYYEDYDKYYSQRSYKITINKGKIIDISIDMRAK